MHGRQREKKTIRAGEEIDPLAKRKEKMGENIVLEGKRK